MNRFQKLIARLFRIPTMDPSNFIKNRIYFDQSQDNIPSVLGLSDARGEEIIRNVAKRFKECGPEKMKAIESLVNECNNNQEVVFTFFCSGVNKGMYGGIGGLFARILSH
jgi:hypothetical protein